MFKLKKVVTELKNNKAKADNGGCRFIEQITFILLLLHPVDTDTVLDTNPRLMISVSRFHGNETHLKSFSKNSFLCITSLPLPSTGWVCLTS